MGERQKQLLKLLGETKPGLSVDELSKGLEITRNAVRQHLASLEAAGLVEAGPTRPSGGGRPQQLYVFTEIGKEMSPRQYSWLAQLVVASVRREDSGDMGKRMNGIGASIAQRISDQYPGLRTHKEKVEKLVEVMDQLGYNARDATPPGARRSLKPRTAYFTLWQKKIWRSAIWTGA